MRPPPDAPPPHHNGGAGDKTIPDQRNRLQATRDDWDDEPCPRCGIPRRDHPHCRFRGGSLYCINDPCPNPHPRDAPDGYRPVTP